MKGTVGRGWLAPVCLLAEVCFAQAPQLDTAIVTNAGGESTILDQIERPEERRAFKALYKKGDAARRLKAAKEFLAAYPDSWMLAEVYEAAAKASMDLSDLKAALDYGKQSLRLYPENALLLVPLAAVQAKEGQPREAQRNAEDALDYLDRFTHPDSIREQEWPAVRDELKASALFTLGRIAITEGLAATGEARRVKLREAADRLTAAARWNSKDPEVLYTLGLAHLALAERDGAARAFAAAARLPGPRQEQARAKLRELGRTEADAGVPDTASVSRTPPAPALEYAGSESCRKCHAVEHASWQLSGMARMFRPYAPENVIGDFRKKQFEDRSGQIVARMSIDKDRHYFATREGGTWRQYAVDYTIGSKWQQAYATQLPDGQIHVFPIQYNKLEGAWINYWKIIDPPGSQRTDPDLFHTMSSRTNYQANCAPCHTSQLHTRKPSSADTLTLEYREPGINCEMCHGPSARHVEAMTAGRRETKAAMDPPLDFARLDSRQFVSVCAQCHMQSALRRQGPAGEWNYPAQGAAFPVRYQSRPLVNFSHRAFYKDGRLRETTLIVEAFERSACFRRGQAHCGSCHDPHPPDAANNPTSLKDRDRPDRMCLQCHSSLEGKIEAHTHHPAGSEASRCVSCHMPRIMNSLMFQARTHQIDDIPRADMTQRFGQAESPNACLLCHKEKDAQWLAARLQSW
ncbi:MAG: cytochrome c3 family protein [Bryobacteraceae bacterium]